MTIYLSVEMPRYEGFVGIDFIEVETLSGETICLQSDSHEMSDTDIGCDYTLSDIYIYDGEEDDDSEKNYAEGMLDIFHDISFQTIQIHYYGADDVPDEIPFKVLELTMEDSSVGELKFVKPNIGEIWYED